MSITRVNLLLLDCDGVLTDGRLYFCAHGEELKVFDVQDGQGIVSWIKAGNQIAIVSGRNSPIVERRASELGIQLVRQGVKDKLATAREIWQTTGIDPQQTAFIGDDVPDIELMIECGFKVAVANAVAEVTEVADYTTQRDGGRGAVREVIDLLMRSNT